MSNESFEVLNKRDWCEALAPLRDGSTPYVVLDDLLTTSFHARLQEFLLGDCEWEELENGHGDMRRVNRPRGESIDLLAMELQETLGPLVAGLKIVSHWAISSRGSSIRAHADNATYSLNLWLTDTSMHSCRLPGLQFYDSMRPSRMPYAMFSNHEQIEEYLQLQGSSVTNEIAYRGNRAILFDSRIIHRVAPSTNSNDSGIRRLNLTLSWDKIEDALGRIAQ